MKTKVTPEEVLSVIKKVEYITPPGTTLTICVLTLQNGAKVTSTNYGTIDPADQDWEKGKQVSYRQALEKVWELENYLLRQELWKDAVEKAEARQKKTGCNGGCAGCGCQKAD